MPDSRFEIASRSANWAKVFLKGLMTGNVRDETQDTPEQRENRPTNEKSAPGRKPEHKQKLESIKSELSEKRRERSQIARELRAARREADDFEYIEQIMRMKAIQQEIFWLKNQLRAAKTPTEGEPEKGSLPNFVIIGAPKCGTTFLYHLLSKHPRVEPAVFKEAHYFDLLFEKGTEWYRQCFPALPKDGPKTITGEATPGYLASARAPQRMAGVIPEARLIALLRNPVDRAYSDFHFFLVGRRKEKGTFEETIAAYFDSPHENRFSRQGIYVDHLLRWAKFFSRDQLLVLKSEEFFEHPQETLKRVLEFLDLPEWKPNASDLQSMRNKGSYEQTMDAAIRRRLEEYFEPHNRRLYEFLGVDFEW